MRGSTRRNVETVEVDVARGKTVEEVELLNAA
jgi:hypothetical protein